MAESYKPWWCRSWNGITHPLRVKSGGTFQSWLCCSWNINTHFLIIENGVNMWAVIVSPMAWNYVVRTGTAWDSWTLTLTLPSVWIDDSQSETWPLNLFIFSSCDMSSRLADGGEPPAARIEHESTLYGRLRSSSKPDSDPVPMVLTTEEHRLEFNLE